MKHSVLNIILMLMALVSVSCSDTQAWYKDQPDYSRSYDPSRDAVADLNAAEDKARVENKNVLIVVGGEWCSWCHILNDYLDRNAVVANKLVENYVVVKVHIGDNGEGSELINSLPPLKGVPHFYVVTPDGKLITSQETSQFEEGRGYNSEKFTNFLEKYKHKESERKE